MRYCDRILMLNEGRVVASGDTLEVLTPENIEKVFGIKSAINTDYGRPGATVLD
jgi:iron complex transport system ATP-binding protein